MLHTAAEVRVVYTPINSSVPFKRGNPPLANMLGC